MTKFEATENSLALMPTLAQSFQDVAFAQADEFINSGQTVQEATSIVASILVETAWIVAGCGVVSGGGTPDKDKFRAVVEAAFEHIKFKEHDATEQIVSTTT